MNDTMKVTGGRLKGKRLYFVSNSKVRPISEKVREAIFDILRDRVWGVSVLDLFCGTGAVGIEAISRGALSVDLIDIRTNSVSKNIRSMDLNDQANIYRMDALRALRIIHKKNKRYGFIFIGAPYPYPCTGEIMTLIDDFEVLSPDGLLMLEYPTSSKYPEEYRHFREKKKYVYGQTAIALYESRE